MTIQHRMIYTVLALASVACSLPKLTYAQGSVFVSGPGSAHTDLQLRVVGSAFVVSNAANAEDAIRDAAITKTEGVAIGAVAGSALKIPVVGGLPIGAAVGVFNKFRKHDVKGFSVAYLSGISAETAIQGSGRTFVIGVQTIQMAGQGADPILVRVSPSSKDRARIVRIEQVVVKQTKSAINPVALDVVSAEQKIVQCQKQTAANGDVTLIPKVPLEPGEYALVLSKPAQAGIEEAPWAWDFRVIP